VRSRRAQSAATLAGLTALLVVLLAVSAATAAGPETRAAPPQGRTSVLAGRLRHALLDVYALDTRRARAQARLASLDSQATRLRKRQALLTEELSATRRSLDASRQRLGDSLRTLYEQGDSDPLAVLLGAESLDDAVTRLDDLTRVADQSRQVVDATAAAQIRLVRVSSLLVTRRAQLSLALASAHRAAVDSIAARRQRLAYVARLRERQRLKASQIDALNLSAQQVEAKSQKLQAAADAVSAAVPGDLASTDPPAPPTIPPILGQQPSVGRTITVSSTGYALKGRTATGIPAGWGVVAVEPSVIPLGTRLTIPGYGEGVAADTGSAVRGSAIDLWFPTLAQARAWGRRIVTITLLDG
jgi:3D (Asp-Asp-Asp) domain-containing protein/peptidoglycan hydrolase CwlO-like protein